jgi:hypothetical protein
MTTTLYDFAGFGIKSCYSYFDMGFEVGYLRTNISGVRLVNPIAVRGMITLHGQKDSFTRDTFSGRHEHRSYVTTCGPVQTSIPRYLYATLQRTRVRIHTTDTIRLDLVGKKSGLSADMSFTLREKSGGQASVGVVDGQVFTGIGVDSYSFRGFPFQRRKCRVPRIEEKKPLQGLKNQQNPWPFKNQEKSWFLRGGADGADTRGTQEKAKQSHISDSEPGKVKEQEKYTWQIRKTYESSDRNTFPTCHHIKKDDQERPSVISQDTINPFLLLVSIGLTCWLIVNLWKNRK